RHDSLGVADGVGGWEGVKNANPALFSRKLMHYSYIEVEKYENIEDYEFVHYYDINPVDILRKSYTQVLEDAYVEGIRGSSTACLAILRDDELRVANLGDCGLAVVRRGEFVFRTEEQQHSFNFPYQIGTGCADRPEDAQVFAFKVQRGDIILVGSDGLFDNLFDEDILEEIQRYVPQPTTPATPSPPTLPPEAIARRAKSVSEESRFTTSPFQNRAMQEGFYHQGGKPDDITVLIAVVADLEDSPDRR
ncbi:phosphatase 2C-like domain-containing protein, partial [Dimargaris cristalligena]